MSVSNDLDSSTGTIFFIFNIFFSFVTLVTSVVNAVDELKSHQLSLTQKSILFVSYGLQICSRILLIGIVVFFTLVKKLKIEDAILLLFLPIIFHWFVQYFISYMTALEFKQMQFFDQILHVLINTFIVIPLRRSSVRKQQTHKSAEMFWSFSLFVTQVLVLSLATYSLHDPHVLFKSDEHLVIISFYLEISRILRLVSLVLLPLGPLTLGFYYSKFHTWRVLNQDRDRSNWCSAWCGVGSLGYEIIEESDGTEDISMDILDVANSPVPVTE